MPPPRLSKINRGWMRSIKVYHSDTVGSYNLSHQIMSCPSRTQQIYVLYENDSDRDMDIYAAGEKNCSILTRFTINVSPNDAQTKVDHCCL